MKLAPNYPARVALVAGALMFAATIAQTPVTPDFLSADVALAKGGNGNGGGGGGGNGNGGGNGHGKGNAGHHSNAAPKGTSNATKRPGKPLKFIERVLGRDQAAKAPKAKTAKVHEEKSAKEEKVGNIRSQMGALNAVHASPNAFRNASPNSRVGRIAAYAEARAAASELNAEIDALKAEIAELEAKENPIKEDLRALEEKTALLEQKQAELLTMNESALALLQAAANKPVTPEVQAEVDAILDQKDWESSKTGEETP